MEITDHCAVTPNLNTRRAHSVDSHVGTVALAGFLQAGTLEAGGVSGKWQQT